MNNNFNNFGSDFGSMNDLFNQLMVTWVVIPQKTVVIKLMVVK